MNLQTLTLKSLVGRGQADRDLALAELASARVTPDDFADEGHRALFVAIEARLKENRQIEAVSLAATARRCPRDVVVDVFAGSEFLGLEPRARLLHEHGMRRRALKTLDAMRALLDDPSHSLAAVAGEVRKAVAGLAADDSDVRDATSDVMAFSESLQRIQRGESEPVVPTGIDALDFALGGGLPSTLVIVGALPGVGKSSLLGAMAGNLASAGVRVGVLSLEDQRGWLLRRLAAHRSAVPLFVLGRRKLGDYQLQRADAAVEGLYAPAKNLVMSDVPGNVESVVSRARQMVADGCRAVFVDHLGEVKLERSDRHDLDVANALQELRGVAKLHGVPMVVACHLRRREGLGVYTEPTLTDFANSSAIERMARVALGLSLIEKERDKLTVSVLKQTEGPANLSFTLNVALSCGLVAQTEPSDRLREKMKWAE